VKKVNDHRFEQIAADLHTDLKDLHETLNELHSRVLPNARILWSALHNTLDSADRTLDVASLCNAVSLRPYRRAAAPCRPCVNWPTTSIVIQMRFCAGGDRRICRRGGGVILGRQSTP